MTAAHCISDELWVILLFSSLILKISFVHQRIGVRAGETDLSKDSNCKACKPAFDYAIEKVISHESFSVETGNDIALIRLSENVKFSNFVSTICLPLQHEQYLDESKPVQFTAMGLGKTEKQENSKILLKTLVSSVPLEECQLFYGKTSMKDFHEGYLCAGGGKNDSCEGKFLFDL